MKRQNNILLISLDPGLHRTLELVASTCNSKFLSAENAKKGVELITAGEANCVIFDLRTLPNPKHRGIAKQRVDKAGVPTLWLNENGNGVPESQKIEPIVKFVMDMCEKAQKECNGGFLRKLSPMRLFRKG